MVGGRWTAHWMAGLESALSRALPRVWQRRRQWPRGAADLRSPPSTATRNAGLKNPPFRCRVPGLWGSDSNFPNCLPVRDSREIPHLLAPSSPRLRAIRRVPRVPWLARKASGYDKVAATSPIRPIHATRARRRREGRGVRKHPTTLNAPWRLPSPAPPRSARVPSARVASTDRRGSVAAPSTVTRHLPPVDAPWPSRPRGRRSCSSAAPAAWAAPPPPRS